MMAHGTQGFHPGMQQHAVHAGHPMAPGMAHNPSQPGAQPGMPPQMVGHMVSAPAGQMNAAAFMGGMPPGNAQAHAMQHLNPQMLQQQQQQQQMAMAQAQGNPQLMQQIQHQRLLQQQAHAAQQRQMMASMYGNMAANGMPMGGQMGQMNAAQFAAMRNGMQRGQPPMNTQQAQMLAQQIAMHQHQVQAQNQQAQQHGGHPGNPAQMTTQAMHLAQQQQQQQAAQQQQQQAQAQQQQQAQIAASMGQVPQQIPAQAPSAPPQQAQPPNQPQPGLPSAQAQQGGSQPQPTSQAPQQASTPAGGQPNAQPNQPQIANQPNQSGPTAQGQAGPGQPQMPNQPQQGNPQLAAQQFANMQQFQMQQAAQFQLQQQKNESMKGQCVLKLLQFGEHLSTFPGAKDDEDTSYWVGFAHEFFSLKGAFRMMVNIDGGTESEHADKSYEISFHALPRFFHTVFQSGVQRMQLVIDQGTVDKPLPGGAHYVENSKASLLYWYSNSLVVGTGSLKAFFDREQKLDLLEFVTTGHEEYITRKLAIQAAKPLHVWTKEWHKLNTTDGKQSPEMSKKSKVKQLKSPPSAPPDFDLPRSTVKPLMGGLTQDLHQLLEINEVLGHMVPLFGFYRENPGISAYDALNQYVAMNINQGMDGQQQVMMNGQPGGPGGMRPGAGPQTPGFNPQFGSPATVNVALPGSPHMGSPAPGQMSAPHMVTSQSQQGTAGTGSTGPSANTSPASNKRRRPSGVKTEDESGAPTPASMTGAVGGPGVNGVKGKPPTPRMGKRQKGNPVNS